MKTIFTIPVLLLTATLSAQVTLSGALSGDYADLSLAFAAIQSGGGSGTVHAAITADITTTETAQLQSTGYQVFICPVGNRTLTITAANKPLIHLNGTQHVVIDGVALNGDSTLTLISTATNSTAAVVLLENDAIQNRISNCTIRGGTISNASSFNGVVALRNTSGSTGCDQDTISGNIIREASSTVLPFIGISMEGRNSTIMNNDCVIADNQVVNIYNAGGISDGFFSFRYNNGTQITGNHFYQTAARTGNSATLVPSMRGIEIADGNSSAQSGNFLVRGNWIGGNAPFCGGDRLTLSNPLGPVVFFGITMYLGSMTSQVDDNHIANLDLSFRDPTSPNWYFFHGMFIAGGNVEIGVQQGNYIGSDTSNLSIILRCRKSNTGSVLCSGINDQGSSSIEIAQNHIGGISLEVQNSNSFGLIGLLLINSYLGGGTIRDNFIGSADLDNNIEVNPVAQKVQIDGIALQGGAYTIERNRIAGIRNSTGYALTGIRSSFETSSGNSFTCIQNHISNLRVPYGSNIDLAGIVVEAIAAAAQNTVLIEEDTIRDLFIGQLVTGNARLFGISCIGGTSATTYFCGGAIENNTIEDLENNVSGAASSCAAISHLMGFKNGILVSGNHISHIHAKSSGLAGIVFSPETTAMITSSTQRLVITGNDISDVSNTSNGIVRVSGIEANGRFPLVAFNRIWDLQTPNTTSTESLVAGIVSFETLGNQTHWIQNNMIALDHSAHGSAQAAGIFSALSGTISVNQTNAEFNSIYLGGAGDAPTSAFLKDGTGKVSLVNNIFYNDCIGGSDTHTAIANIAATPATNWLADASDHNYLVSRDPEALNLWGTDPQNITAWQTISNSDEHSYTRIADVSTFSDQLFVDKITANLDLQLDHFDEVLVLQNAGLPVIGITQDFFGNTRNTTTPDIGAREFATIVGTDQEDVLQSSISVSPNPTADFILVSIDADAPSEYALQLTDAQGKIVFQMNIAETTGFQKRISLQQLPQGVYALTVAGAKGAVTRQVVKN
ncbi:MAG: T9SS type A sorting domain-containing protein [Saprospiraceae bacterium]|nr:T9SS type A sorting domain-containing protein [Saprospiraceae bacterium]